MTEIKRYSPDFMFDLEMVVCGDGEFVAYEDHAAIVSALQEQVRALAAEGFADYIALYNSNSKHHALDYATRIRAGEQP